jgi:hypothetical protein
VEKKLTRLERNGTVYTAKNVHHTAATQSKTGNNRKRYFAAEAQPESEYKKNVSNTSCIPGIHEMGAKRTSATLRHCSGTMFTICSDISTSFVRRAAPSR